MRAKIDHPPKHADYRQLLQMVPASITELSAGQEAPSGSTSRSTPKKKTDACHRNQAAGGAVFAVFHPNRC